MIQSSRRLQQGNPLSSFLFILRTKVLSHLLKREESMERINETKVSQSAPSMSHLLFVYNTMVFARATQEEALAIREIFSIYTGRSRQALNLQKSSISFSWKESSMISLAGSLGIPHLDHPGKYLGLALIIPKSKKQAFLYIKEKIMSKIAGWKSKLLRSG